MSAKRYELRRHRAPHPEDRRRLLFHRLEGTVALFASRPALPVALRLLERNAALRAWCAAWAGADGHAARTLELTRRTRYGPRSVVFTAELVRVGPRGGSALRVVHVVQAARPPLRPWPSRS